MDQCIKFLNFSIFFHVQYKRIASIVWILSFGISVFLWQNYDLLAGLIIVFINAAIFAFVITGVMASRLNKLDSRMNEDDGGPIWKVEINGVDVGEVNDAKYAAIQKAVLLDLRTHAAVIVNLGKVLNNLFEYLVRAIPIFTFWVTLMFYLMNPEGLSEMLASIIPLSSSDVSASLSGITQLIISAIVLLITANVIFGRYFGLINVFEKECNDRLRRTMESVATGDILLYRLA